jgi:hypothetical protein
MIDSHIDAVLSEQRGQYALAEAFREALTHRVLTMQAQGPVTRDVLAEAAADVAARFFPPPRIAQVVTNIDDGRITFQVAVHPVGPVTFAEAE